MADQAENGPNVAPEVLRHYNQEREAARLSAGPGLLERARTQEILSRYLPPAPACVLDIGGGAGVHAIWLAGQGYETHLIDPVAIHIQQALDASRQNGDAPLASASVGDARKLDYEDESAQAVLLLGPLYHLTERCDRIAALTECRRVLCDGGVLFAAGISRYASALDGLFRGYLEDPEFVKIVERDLRDGQHRNTTDHPSYFTTAYFHTPDELLAEVLKAGFTVEKLIGIEGLGWLLNDFESHWDDDNKRAALLRVITQLESVPALAGVSAHMMVVARKLLPTPSPRRSS